MVSCKAILSTIFGRKRMKHLQITETLFHIMTYYEIVVTKLLDSSGSDQ